MTNRNLATDLPSWTAWVGLAVTWAAGAIGVARYKMDLRNAAAQDEKRKRERDAELEAMARRVCREFGFEADVMRSRDERIREVAATQIDRAFADRSTSFVDVERYNADQKATERRLESVETALRENTKELGKIGGQITSEVTRNLTTYLSTKVIAGKD